MCAPYTSNLRCQPALRTSESLICASTKLFLIYESLDLLDFILFVTKHLVLVQNTYCLFIIHSFSYEITNIKDPFMVSWI